MQYSIVFAGAIRQNALTSNATDIAVTNIMKNWLRYAYERSVGRKEREEHKHTEAKENAL